MWTLKRIQKDQNVSDSGSYRLIVGEYLVGRKGCQIQVLGDQTVSRKHAYITVNCKENTQINETYVTIKDISKFGTSINGIKCENSIIGQFKDGDEITFGTQSSLYRLTCEPLVVFASCLENSKKKILKSQIHKLGGYMVSEWQKECTHLVMDALSFTVKVIYALVTCCPIVKTSYFDDLIQQIASNSELPTVERYMPPIKEELIDPKLVSFHPNEARKSLFSEKLFLFLDKRQYKRLDEAVTLAGGKAMLKESSDGSDDVDDLLTDVNTLVISVDLKSQIPSDREAWIGHVGEVLASCNRRPIAETEIGLAILHLSLEEHCNPSMNHIPRITKHIVSKSLSTMEAMSQRVNESQNVSATHLSPADQKKPFPSKLDVGQPEKTHTTHSPPTQTRKRSRDSPNDDLPLSNDTPLAKDTPIENKRQKLSPSSKIIVKQEVTHISESVQDFHSVPQKSYITGSIDGKNPQKFNVSKSDITHVSQSQDSPSAHISNQNNSSKNTPDTIIPSKLNITHVSQSEDTGSLHVTGFNVSPNVSRGRSNSKADITHVSQSEGFNITNDGGIIEKKRRRSSNSELPSNYEKANLSTDAVCCETPTPEMSSRSKRLRISDVKSDITHISQTERSPDDENPVPRSPTVALFDYDGSFSESKPKGNQSSKQDSGGFQPCCTVVSPCKPTTSSDNQETRDTDNFTNNDIPINTKYIKTAKDDPVLVESKHNLSVHQTEQEVPIVKTEKEAECCCVPESPEHNMLPDDDLKDETPPSGWMSKKSQRVKLTTRCVQVKEENKSEELDGVKTDGSSTGQGEPTKCYEDVLKNQNTEVAIKQEPELPRNVLCIEYTELVVARDVAKKNLGPVKNVPTNLRNTKRFRKQQYPGGGGGLPRIIGGNDLMVFSSKTKDVEDWFQEIQLRNKERDQEDQEADNLFKYDPPNKRRNRK